MTKTRYTSSRRRWLSLAMGTGAGVILSGCISEDTGALEEPQEAIDLPRHRQRGLLSIEEALNVRRSLRDYGDGPLTMAEVSQLLWAAQGVTDARGYRTAPSAGALYPLEIYLVVGDIVELDPGVYRYVRDEHQLVRTAADDRREALAGVALGQAWVSQAAIDLVMAGVYERTTVKYGHRGRQYVHMEVGHAAQNVYLQAAALGLGTVVVGAFYDDGVQRTLGLPGDHVPLYIMPVGRSE